MLNRVRNRTLALTTTALLLVIPAGAQQAPTTEGNNEAKVQELLNDKKHSFEDVLHGEPGAVAVVQKIFELSSDQSLKERMASILLGIGVRDKVYRDYLEHAAREALADDTPWPIKYDDKGKELDWNPVFLEWCKNRQLRVWDTEKRMRYEIPVPWYYLASAGDPSFYNLLIEGLHSHNLMIVAWAAEGLAKLQDPRAIEPLIEAGRKTPGDGLGGIRTSLLYFSDPRAQAAAEELYSSEEKKFLELERQHVKEKGIKGLFQW